MDRPQIATLLTGVRLSVPPRYGAHLPAPGTATRTLGTSGERVAFGSRSRPEPRVATLPYHKLLTTDASLPLLRAAARFDSGWEYMKDTASVGTLTEGRVLAALLTKGYVVAIPFGVAKYDLIVDMGDLKKVQCKTGRLIEGSIAFNAYSQNGTTKVRNNYIGLVDYFGVWCPALPDDVYLVPIEPSMRNEVRLRIEPTNKVQGIRWAKDFKI
jgi:hypothetical protein